MGLWMGLKLAVVLRPQELVCKRTVEGSGKSVRPLSAGSRAPRAILARA